MQLGRPRRAKKLVPRLRPNSHHAGKPCFQVAVFHRAKNSAQVGAERSHRRSRLRARLQFGHYKNCRPRQRRGHRLRNNRFGAHGRANLHLWEMSVNSGKFKKSGTRCGSTFFTLGRRLSFATEGQPAAITPEIAGSTSNRQSRDPCVSRSASENVPGTIFPGIPSHAPRRPVPHKFRQRSTVRHIFVSPKSPAHPESRALPSSFPPPPPPAPAHPPPRPWSFPPHPGSAPVTPGSKGFLPTTSRPSLPPQWPLHSGPFSAAPAPAPSSPPDNSDPAQRFAGFARSPRHIAGPCNTSSRWPR